MLYDAWAEQGQADLAALDSTATAPLVSPGPRASMSRLEKIGSTVAFQIKWFLFHIHQRGYKV